MDLMDMMGLDKEFIRISKNIDLINKLFINACQAGCLDDVKYLLTSPDLLNHADIHAYEDSGFQSACLSGHLDVVKYLLTSPDLKEYSDICRDNDYGFRIAYAYDRINIVKYLLDYNKEYQDKYLYIIENLVNEGHVDFLPYLKQEKIETEECEIFL